MSKKINTTTQTEQNATDEAIIQGANAVLQTGGVSLGVGAELQTGGQSIAGNRDVSFVTNVESVDREIIDSALATIVSSNELSAGNVQESLNLARELGSSFSGDLKDLTSKTLAQVGDINRDVMSGLTTLAESKQTDGEPKRNQTILLIVLGGLVLLGMIFHRR